MSKQQYVSFDTTQHEHDTIRKIADRCQAIGEANCKPITPETHRCIQMDVTACHCNGRPLRLDDLLKADVFNFTHDIVGIREHLDRHTGKLLNFFVPRFAAATSQLVNPWGNERDGYAVGVGERLDAIKGMTLDGLFKCLAWPENEDSVDRAIRRVLTSRLNA